MADDRLPSAPRGTMNDVRKTIREEIDRLRRESAEHFKQSQELRKRAREIDAKIQELLKILRSTPP
jgi:uncharacterized coiled-coil DUF342 family protein